MRELKKNYEELLTDPVGVVGKRVSGEDWAIGTKLWVFMDDEEKFEQLYANENVSTRRLKNLGELRRALRTHDDDGLPRGATRLIEITEPEDRPAWNRFTRPDSDLNTDAILELPHWCFRSVDTAIRYLENSGKTEVYVYRGGNENPAENDRRDGVWRKHQETRGESIHRILHEQDYVYLGKKNVTSLAADEGRYSVPLKKNCVLRSAPGETELFFKVMRLSPAKYARALLAADRTNPARPRGHRAPRPLITKCDLIRLMSSLHSKASVALSTNNVHMSIEGSYYLRSYAIHSCIGAFELIPKIKGLEPVLHKDEHGQLDKSFWSVLQPLYESRYCLLRWWATEKHQSAFDLLKLVDKYAARCIRLEKKEKAELEKAKEERRERVKELKNQED